MSIRLKRTILVCTVIGVAVLIAGVLFAVKRQNTLPEWEVVGRFHKLGHEVYPSGYGFLYRNESNLYIMSDWQGRERWRVTIKSTPERLLTELLLSPSGKTLATAHTISKGIVVTTYRNGKAVGNALLPTPYPFKRMQIFDNGRILLVLSHRIYLIEGAKILAEHKHPHAEGITISQDGTTMVAPSVGTGKYNFVYSECTIAKGQLLIRKELHAKVQLQYPNMWLIYNDGTAIFTDGTIIKPTQQIISNDRWTTRTSTYDNDNSGDYLIQFKGDPHTEYRFFNPTTLDQWECKLPDSQRQALAVNVSRDGQTVLLRNFGTQKRWRLARSGYFQEPGGEYLLFRRHSGIVAKMSANRLNRLLGKEQFVGYTYLSPDEQMLLVDPGFVGREENESDAVLLRLKQMK